MKYDPQKHHRRSIRLYEYDYGQSGDYYITIVTQNWVCLFGDLEDGYVVLNDAGKMIKKWYFELENKFPDIRCDEYVIMPNHFHAIIINVGADLRVCPKNHSPKHTERGGERRFDATQKMANAILMPHIKRANTQVRPYRKLCNGLKP